MAVASAVGMRIHPAQLIGSPQGPELMRSHTLHSVARPRTRGESKLDHKQRDASPPGLNHNLLKIPDGAPGPFLGRHPDPVPVHQAVLCFMIRFLNPEG